MSKGTKIVPVRIREGLLSLIDEHIESLAKHSKYGLTNRGEWIRRAIMEKLRHACRGGWKPK